MSKTFEAERQCRHCEGAGEVQHSYLPWDGGTCPACDGKGTAIYDDLCFGDLWDAELSYLSEEVLNAYGYTKVGGEPIEIPVWMSKDLKTLFCSSYS